MDLALVWSPDEFTADLGVEGNDFLLDGGLESSVVASILTDRRAEPDDKIPDGTGDRRGWWADAIPVVAGDKFGSRLWLLDRSKDLPSTLRDAETYAREALEWMVEDRLASAVGATAESLPGGILLLTTTIDRPGRDPVSLRFYRHWEAQAARR